ncbi:hypothetical protein AB0H00_12920 [Nocardia sp. NPDC023852]|uniref:hypothetical protein n=1 Tax=Nocardia sp. NPDC023852 TaxID=3154697 RepID=UPI0033EAB132
MGELDDLRKRWSTLVGQASSGELEFDENHARVCVHACETALSGLKAIQGYISAPPSDGQPLDTLLEFGNLPSGISMAGTFYRRATHLSNVLGSHLSIVTEMATTFALAEKQYANAEEESRNSFADIAPAKLSGKPERLFAKGLREHNTKSLIPASVGVRDSGIPSPEAGESLSYTALYHLGQSIRPQPVADAASGWLYLAEQLKDVFSGLREKIVATQNSWSGLGGDAARKAVSDYDATTKPLVDNMTTIGNNLHYASAWLYTAKWTMPTSATIPDSGAVAVDLSGVGLEPAAWGDDPLPRFRNRYEVSYRVGFSESAVNIPVLPVPDPVTDSAGDAEPGGSADASGVSSGYPGGVGGPGLSSGYPGGVGGPGLTAASVDTSGLTGALPTAGGGPAPVSGIGEPSAQLPTSPSGSDLGQLSNIAQQAMSGAQTAAQAAQAAGHPAIPPVGSMNAPNAAADAAKASRLAGLKGGGPGGPAAALAKEAALARDAAQSKLFPRAGLPGTAAGTPIGRTGMAPMAGAPGTPGSAGAPQGAGNKDQGKEHKRPDFLDSAEHLEEAIGEPMAVKPVLDQ